ncbi:MAG: GNAT family N-acetyltransferase [Bacteroides sp.]|nr:GNAT family N-acetyltransferase [Bacteroides sp.]
MNRPLPLLTDGTVRLRALEPSDIDIMMEWENDTQSWGAASTSAPYSRRIIEDYVLTYDADIFSARQLRLIIEYDGKAVGALDLTDFDPVNHRAGIGIIVDPRFRGKGYGKRAIDIAARYCRERIGMHQLWAIVAQDNAASRQLFESAGFVAGGRMRSWISHGSGYTDAYIYQLLLAGK